MKYRVLPYGSSLGLLTDLYQLTMGQVYWTAGMSSWKGAFTYSYRTAPRGGGYAMFSGLETLVDFLSSLSFTEDDLSYLSRVPGADGAPIFNPRYLEFLGGMRFDCNLDAVPEGTAVFPYEPIIRLTGTLISAQLIETALLNFCNYATAVSTEASRIVWAAGGAPVIDFSPRRAPGPDGSLITTRSAYIAGFAGTSNVWAARHLEIPAAAVKGTMAHSLVMSFDSELEAFAAYADAMPNNCLFLVDTYGSLEGVAHAIAVGRRLREAGHHLLGIRLDSGDLATLSSEARSMLDQAGFADAVIFASNDLDEFLVQSLRLQGAAIGVWAVGTNIVVPPLGGVYKLAAVQKPGSSEWERKIKLSDQPAKVSMPGILQVRRFRTAAGNTADAIYDETLGIDGDRTMVSFRDPTKQMTLPPRDSVGRDLLKPVLRRGELVVPLPSLEQIRAHARDELMHVPDAIKRFENPHEYRVGLEKSLFEVRERMIMEHRQSSGWNR